VQPLKAFGPRANVAAGIVTAFALSLSAATSDPVTPNFTRLVQPSKALSAIPAIIEGVDPLIRIFTVVRSVQPAKACALIAVIVFDKVTLVNPLFSKVFAATVV
jgi:hypothetical protein